VFVLALVAAARACTNFIVSKGASADGSTLISYAADAHTLFGELYYRPAADYPAGATMDIYDWDSGMYLGRIPQVNHTYLVVGNMNEFQVAIGETTYGGREELVDPYGLIDYGNLMWIGLQRSKTARELIYTMVDLANTYGYVSSGESFSIQDPNEVWIMEIIGKGPGNTGILWAARRVPDGYVCGHANQARITQLPVNDPDTLFSDDVISFARSKGWFTGSDSQFSFSDTYNPVTFEGARGCESRVWAFFRNVAGSSMDQYYNYIYGNIQYDSNGYATNRMPLWVLPTRKLYNRDIFTAMRDHFEGTPLDLHDAPGTGDGQRPYRWRPMTFTSNGVEYTNERAVATQQTGFSFVAQSRSWLPDPIGGIFWFGVDDTATTVYMPMYCSITKPPENFKEGNGNMITYSATAGFWLWNRVSNFAYLRYDYMYPDIQKVQGALESEFVGKIASVDKVAQSLYKTKPADAIDYLTTFSLSCAVDAFNRWQELDHYLLIKYMDGNVKKESGGQFLTNGYGEAAFPDQPGYEQWFYDDIAEHTGDVHVVIEPRPTNTRTVQKSARQLKL